MIAIGAYAGFGAGVILTFFSHIAPRFGAGNYIEDLDQPKVFGYELSRREAHLIGLFVHLLTTLVFGVLFAWGVQAGLISGFNLLPILGWSLVQLLFVGLIIMPLEGHGWFGLKHDAWFPVDVFITNILWGLLYLGLTYLWLG